MKSCKSCFKEIESAASKCPHCQTYQVWYKNPQLFGLIFPFVLIPVMFYSMGLWFNKEYAGNENSFVIKEISATQGEYNKLALNYLIENKSNIKWHSISYQITALDSDNKLIISKTGQDYSWIIQPNQSTYLTIEVDNSYNANKWVLKILDIKSGKF